MSDERKPELELSAPDALAAVEPEGISLAAELLKADLAKARRAGKAAHKAEVLAKIRSGELRPPEGQFSVIVMDPPWEYDTAVETGSTHRGLVGYPTMSLRELRALAIPAAEACVLWLWATNAFVGDAWQLALGWGFTPKTMLTWVKDVQGVGHYLQNDTEQCLVCVRGNPVIDVSAAWKAGLRPTTTLRAARGLHSEKPAEFYRLVEVLCPCAPGARLEMFARTARPGWVVWGAEAPDAAEEQL